jgi:hypothetical protein
MSSPQRALQPLQQQLRGVAEPAPIESLAVSTPRLSGTVEVEWSCQIPEDHIQPPLARIPPAKYQGRL